MPRWFHGHEQVPHLRSLAEALRRGRHLELRYRRGTDTRDPAPRVVAPLGLVNKAGTWYLVAMARGGRVTVFRAGRIASARVLAGPAGRPAGFELAEFWERWSQEFAASRPRLRVRLRASPGALAVFPEVFGDAVREAMSAALPPDEQGWQEVTLSFEHKLAAAHRLAGFGAQVQVLSPPDVREQLLDTARGILSRYGAGPG
jgi:predicted DNA-binding transcriptional regulator YafY